MIAITGGEGLLGWHSRCHFYSKGVDVKHGNRSVFTSEESLDKFVEGTSVILHFAGMNRGEEADIFETNVRLTNELLKAIDRTDANPHIIFSSSTHIDKDTKYGESKRVCSDLISEWVEKSNDRRASILVLPNVFGECGRPFYNSVVSTFCHVLAQGGTPSVKVDSQMSLIHARRVADIVESILEQSDSEMGVVTKEVEGEKLSVSELLNLLSKYDEMYRQIRGVIPNLESNFHLDLFNTYRSYLFPEFYSAAIKLHIDHRGSLVEVVKSQQGGQTFMSSTKPNVVRGDHYHRHKVERFMVVGGDGLIRVRRLFDRKIHEFHVNGHKPSFVDMPAFHTHSIENVGDTELTTVFWSHEIFDPDNPDTFPEPVIGGNAI